MTEGESLGIFFVQESAAINEHIQNMPREQILKQNIKPIDMHHPSQSQTTDAWTNTERNREHKI